MRHIDFTKTLILAEEDTYHVTRLNEDEQLCELCSGPAEYTVLGDTDRLGQCNVHECQECLIRDLTCFEAPSTYVVIS